VLKERVQFFKKSVELGVVVLFSHGETEASELLLRCNPSSSLGQRKSPELSALEREVNGVSFLPQIPKGLHCCFRGERPVLFRLLRRTLYSLRVKTANAESNPAANAEPWSSQLRTAAKTGTAESELRKLLRVIMRFQKD
jgi:hypothetical protein